MGKYCKHIPLFYVLKQVSFWCHINKWLWEYGVPPKQIKHTNNMHTVNADVCFLTREKDQQLQQYQHKMVLLKYFWTLFLNNLWY